MNIGKSVVIKGELNGSEDLTIEGQVEGKIELRQNVLTIGPNGRIKAQVFAKSVIILGEVTGNVTATEKVDIRDNGSVDGDIAAPRVAIAEGAHFRGSIDMQRARRRRPTRRPRRPRRRPRPPVRARPAVQPGRRRWLAVRRRHTRRRHAVTGDAVRLVSHPATRLPHGHSRGGARPLEALASNLELRPMLSDLLRWGGKRPGQADAAGDAPRSARRRAGRPVEGASEVSSALAHQTDSPVLIDFGPVIGTNVAFFGERLGCKLFIEDLVADIDRHTRAGTRDAAARRRSQTRFRHADASVDGVLCWDFFDFLDKPSAQALARQIVRMLRPGGAVMGFFCTSAVERVAVHEVRDRRRHLACATGTIPAPAVPSSSCRTATSSRCSTASSCRSRSC